MDAVEKKSIPLLQARLASVNQAHLSTDPVRADYVLQYKGGLIGRDFKTLAQFMVFIVNEIVPDQLLKCWLHLGNLMALLWYPEIDGLDLYCVSFDFLVQVEEKILILQNRII